MASTHYYGLIYGAHGRGNVSQGVRLLDPIGGIRLEMQGETTPAVVNTIITGNTSGAKARVTRVVAANKYECESILVGGLPLGFVQGETVTYDSGGTATHGNSTFAPLFDAQQWPLTEQHLSQRLDVMKNTSIPNAADDTVFYDRYAKLARQITVTGASGAFNKGERYAFSGGAQFTVLKATDLGGGTSFQIWMVRVTGTPATGETLTAVTAGATGAGTVTVVEDDPPTGMWMPFYPYPNWNGLASEFEVIPFGCGTPNKGSTIGPIQNLLRRMWEFHDADDDPAEHGVRFIPFAQDDYGDTAQDGGVYIQKVEIAGLVGGWTRGETLSVAATGWQAKLVDYDSTTLYVSNTNGIALKAGDTIVGQTSGVFDDADGPAKGWQKGSTMFDAMVAEMATAQAAENSLYGGAAAKWEGFAVWLWEGEISIWAQANLLYNDADDWKQAWATFIADLRAECGNPTMPIAIMRPQLLYQPSITFAAAAAYTIVQDVANSIDNVSAVSSDSFQRGSTADINTEGATYLTDWMRLEDYETAGELIWRSLRFMQYEPPGGTMLPLPIFLTFGQSQGVGFFNSGAFQGGADNDPDLYSSASFPGVSTLDDKVFMWNAQEETLQWQAFDCIVNANTFQQAGPNSQFSGLHCVLALRMKKRFGDGQGGTGEIGLINLNVSGSSVHHESFSANGTWDPNSPGPDSRDVSNCTCTVLASPARGRFTGAAAAFDGWATGQRVSVSGSLLGNLGVGGNNHTNGEGYIISDIAADGSWMELTPPSGSPNFVAEGPITFTFARGPKRLVDDATASIRAALQQCVTELNRIPVSAGIVFWNGEADATDGNEANYAAALKAALDWCHSEFAPKMQGATACPTVIMGLTQNTPVGTDEAIQTIKAAQQAEAASRSNAAFVDTDDLPLESSGIWPRTSRQDNGIHHTLRGSIMGGYLCDEAFGQLNGIPPHPDGAAALDFGTKAAVTANPAEDTGDAAETAVTDTGSTDEATATASLTISAGDSQSIIDVIDAAIATGGDVASYTVNGRTVTMRSLSEMLQVRRYYEAQKARSNNVRATKVRFN